jgi:diacylglycerol kinase family enzyme
MSEARIEVIATTISGSLRDWSKVERIVPLFAEHGFTDVRLQVADSHAAARAQAREAAAAGAVRIISAGGSGTFNAVLEGCVDSGAPLEAIRLGFLRKGSADLIGKVLGMPDAIEPAIAIFASALRADRCQPCDLLQAESFAPGKAPRHFVGYGGAGIFGRIPHFTENRAIKWYKGILSQVFGDLGPFTTGMILATGETLLKRPWTGPRRWRIVTDGVESRGAYHALIIVNGYLGPDLPFADDPLGSGRFHCFALRDEGAFHLLAQAKRARDRSIMADPARWGMESFSAADSMELAQEPARPFPLNVDGSTLVCPERARLRRIGQIRLLAGEHPLRPFPADADTAAGPAGAGTQ